MKTSNKISAKILPNDVNDGCESTTGLQDVFVTQANIESGNNFDQR
ncbi:hypothetical protein LBSG162_05820 [Lentilactobacillus buchneri subsp. silagei]|nr:hypothetical protein Ltb232_10710 [Lentilactobacillus buchneri subsp. silagei]GED91477.1 hypothetical protein LBSG162_05820 [Lentilactobacillus buchneri subsp. silagei]GED93850.1 hypothetical protein LBSP_04100 [Lentilactobacillus buchneri subsp. silagei]